MNTAFHDKRVLITYDLDFGDLAIRLRQPHAGILLLRLEPAELETKLERLSAGLVACRENPGALVVVSERRVRIRRP